MKSITSKIITRINSKQRGWIFSPKDFLDLGSRAIVDKVMSRLTKNGTIRKISRGIYDYPRINKTIGIISPNMDDLAKIIASKTKNKIFCSGAMAANLIGLSTQMPMKSSYLTTGPSIIKKIGNHNIIFKHTRVPIFEDLPYIANLTLQSMVYLGKNAIDDNTINHYAKKLSANDKLAISKTIPNIPSWMADVIHKIQSRAHG